MSTQFKKFTFFVFSLVIGVFVFFAGVGLAEYLLFKDSGGNFGLAIIIFPILIVALVCTFFSYRILTRRLIRE